MLPPSELALHCRHALPFSVIVPSPCRYPEPSSHAFELRISGPFGHAPDIAQRNRGRVRPLIRDTEYQQRPVDKIERYSKMTTGKYGLASPGLHSASKMLPPGPRQL